MPRVIVYKPNIYQCKSNAFDTLEMYTSSGLTVFTKAYHDYVHGIRSMLDNTPLYIFTRIIIDYLDVNKYDIDEPNILLTPSSHEYQLISRVLKHNVVDYIASILSENRSISDAKPLIHHLTGFLETVDYNNYNETVILTRLFASILGRFSTSYDSQALCILSKLCVTYIERNRLKHCYRFQFDSSEKAKLKTSTLTLTVNDIDLASLRFGSNNKGFVNDLGQMPTVQCQDYVNNTITCITLDQFTHINGILTDLHYTIDEESKSES